MTDHSTDRLSAYVDGELGAQERREIDSHLQSCAACREVVEDLRLIVADARGLEDGEPARDLWPAIAARIDAEREVVLPVASQAPGRRRFSFTLPQLAAASLALVLVSGGSVWMVGLAGDEPALARSPSGGQPTLASSPPAEEAVPVPVRSPSGGEPVLARVPAGDVRALPAAAMPIDDSLAAHIQNMERMLLDGETPLDPATIAVLRRNLLIIDQALAEAGAALRSDPANPYLSRHYQNTMEKKLELLRRAGSIGRGNT